MPFSPLGNLLPKAGRPELAKQAGLALALEAGAAFLAAENPALAERTRLVSVKAGLLHAYTLSAPAKEELSLLKNRLFEAIKKAMPVELTDLRIEVRGRLADEGRF